MKMTVANVAPKRVKEEHGVMAKKVSHRHFARVPNGYARLTFLGELTPKAHDLLHYVVNQVALTGNIDTWVHFEAKQLAEILSPGSTRVANRSYDALWSAIKQVTKLEIEHEYIDPNNNHLMRTWFVPMDGVKWDTEDNTYKLHLSESFRNYLTTAMQEGWTKVLLLELFTLPSVVEKNLYLVASSLVPLTIPRARFISYKALRHKMGWKGAYYQDPRRLRIKTGAVLKKINQRVGRMFHIADWNEHGIIFDDATARREVNGGN